MSDKDRGQIITFYSYKGGTGRTMALANVACLLAQRLPPDGKGVLVVDWDLEAPGLHRYFRGRGASGADDPNDERAGLIDLFYEIDRKTDAHLARARASGAAPDSEELARAVLDEIRLGDYVLPTEVGSLGLLKAGRFERKNPEAYSARVNTFRWEALYQKSPKLIRVLAERLAEQYRYVLIDSRTGITDISGICTMLLPEKLVVVFTPNRQSLLGGLRLAERATDYRRESSDLRPLVVFPLVSRVEANEPALREEWRFGGNKTIGYQPEFEKLFQRVYGPERISLKSYFDEMQIQQIPRYAYGEEIAVLVERIEDRFSLRRGYQTFATKLVESRAPWAKGGDDVKPTERHEPGLLDLLRAKVWSAFSSVTATSSRVLAAVLALLLAVAIWALVKQSVAAAVGRREAEQLRQELAQAQEARAQLEVLEAKLREAQEPLKALAAKDQQINELFEQVTQVSTERDQARQDALTASTQAATARRAAQQAQAEAARVRTQSDEFLERAMGERARAEQCQSELRRCCNR